MDQQREISAEEKALVRDWNKRIEAALSRVEKDFKRFEKNRKLLLGRGENQEGQKTEIRANLFFANMAALLPQVYAKDPEYSAQISSATPSEQQRLIRKFADTSEKALTKCLVQDANLKKQAKKLLRSAYATSIGWWKLSWQEDRRKDPIILNKIKDTQDNIDRIEMLLKELEDPQLCANEELTLAELKQTLAGLETQQEVTVARGLALDFVMSEDVLPIDEGVRTVSDYLNAGAIGHRVWMTPDQYESRFGYKPTKAKSYSEKPGGVITADNVDKEKASLLCVWEVWSQLDNRIYYVCIGEEGFCEEPKSPDWTGKRWYPFFLLAFNEVDGSFYPLSDIELTEKLVEEYNQNREDFVRDRQGALPINIVRKGGALTDDDLNKLKNRQGSDLVLVEGVPGTPLQNDIFSGSLANLNAQNYDTAPARQDMEMLIGGGDAARGAVLKAKTATEAEIVSQGLRGRSAERQDTLEDVLNELGPYALEILLRKMDETEIKAICGPDSVWPAMSIDEIFNLVSIQVRGGSTGKPDRLQEQDRWTKLLPVIQNAIEKVATLREAGQEALANAVIELTRETLRRFDERVDIEQFLPPVAEGEEDPATLKQQVIQLQQQLQQAQQIAEDAINKVEKGYLDAATQIATSANPAISAQAFAMSMQVVEGNPPPPEQMPPPVAPVASPEPAQIQ